MVNWLIWQTDYSKPTYVKLAIWPTDYVELAYGKSGHGKMSYSHLLTFVAAAQ